MKEDLDDFVKEERSDDDFEAFDEKDKQKKAVKKDWDFSVDDEQEPLLEDEEEFDDDGNPRELDFGKYD